MCGIAGFGAPPALADPLVGAYYYPWYLPNNGHSFSQTLRQNLAPAQAPAIGLYNSSSASVISAHIDQSHQANIDFWAMSWWGPGTAEDSCILNNILTNPRASELKYAVMYESSSNSLLGPDFNNPDFSHFTQDFQYLASHEFANPNYLRINGRPVIFMYITRAYFNTQTARDAVANMRATLQSQYGYSPYIVGDDFYQSGVDPTRASLWDAITDYDVYGTAFASKGSTTAGLNQLTAIYDNARASAASLGVGFVPGVTPGFNDSVNRVGNPPVPRYMTDTPTPEEGSLFTRELNEVAVPRTDPLASNMLMVTSFNEWHEDTQIEASNIAPPTSQDDSGTQAYTQGYQYTGYGTLYLDILKQQTGPQWFTDASTNWSTTGNWAGAVPNAVDAVANFQGAITTARTVTTDVPVTLGAINFRTVRNYTLAGPGPITMDVSSGNASINVFTTTNSTAASENISAPLIINDPTTISVDANASLTISGSITDAAGKALTKIGTGELTITGPQHYASPAMLTVGEGTFTLGSNAGADGTANLDLVVNAPTRFSVSQNLRLLSIGPNVTATVTAGGEKVLEANQLSLDSNSKLDLNDNDLVVNNGVFSDIQNLVFSGYRTSPDTTANGIVSTTSQNTGGITILKVFDNAVYASFVGSPITEWPDPGLFASPYTTVGPNAIIGKYTYLGDTNLDGVVSSTDYLAIDSFIGQTDIPGLGALMGDTNFDGVVSATDYLVIDSQFGYGVGNPLAASGASSVPEPMGLIWVGVGWLATPRRRRCST